MYNSNLSKAGLTTMGFFPKKTKTISQIKRDNQQTRQSTYHYIDSMYRTGNNFKYNLKKPHQGTHRSHLSSLEEYVREMAKVCPNDLSKYNIIKNQCDIMRIQLKDDYNKLKYELTLKENKIKDLKDKLQKNSIKNKNVNYDDIMVITFVSMDSTVQCGIKCLPTDTFAEVEEKLYKRYDNLRDTNNMFTANAKPVLRFKKIFENNIKDGDILQLFKLE